MKNPCRLLVTLALLVPIAPAVAAPRYGPQQDGAAVVEQELPSARKIIDRFLAVTDPDGIYAKSKSIRVTGTIEIAGMGLKGTLEVLQARPNLMLTQGDIAGIGPFAEGYDGEVGWDLQPMMGPSLAEGFALQQRKVGAVYDLGLYPPELFEKIETVAREVYEGKDCYKLRLLLKPFDSDDPDIADEKESKDYRESVEYFDVESGFRVAKISHMAAVTGKTRATVVFSDYTEFAGIKMPSVQTMSIVGQKNIIRFAKAELDTLKKDAFLLPADIKTLVEASAKKEAAAKKEEKEE